MTWLGQVDYLAAWTQQKALVAAFGQRPLQADQLLLLEHPPTYTLGSAGDMANLLVSEETLKKQGVALYNVNRGGDITFHGPGQLVGYPIFNLKRVFEARGSQRPDLHTYVRDVEEVLIRTLADFGVNGRRYPGYTGVWVDTPQDGPLKMAAIGIRVSSKGISSHGFALNVTTDLAYFAQIIPCGIREHGVTNLAAMTQQPVTIADVIPPLTQHFGQIFGTEVHAPTSLQETL